MKNREEIEKSIKGIWFKNHEAHYSKVPSFIKDTIFEIIIWKNPNRNTYSVTYIRMCNYLFVIGDIGDATYYTGFDSFKEWAESDIGYFSGKCVASEYGRQYLEWDPDYLKEGIEKALEQSDKDWHNFCSSGGDSALSNEQEWIVWLTLNGNDFWEDPFLYPYGKCISMRCHGHLIGLKMAMEQIKKKNGKNEL